MAIEESTRTEVVAGASVVSYYRYQDSVSSPRINGKLVLRQNPYELRVARLTSWSSAGNFAHILQHHDVNNSLHNRHADFSSAKAAINAELTAKMQGKLRKGGGSLGVSLATWRQSSSMVKGRLKAPTVFLGNLLGVLRSARTLKNPPRVPRGDPTMRDISRYLDRLERRLPPRMKPKTGPGSPGGKSLADHILEYEFGWKPLIEDVRTALSGFTQAIPPEYLRVAAKRELSSTRGNFTGGGDPRNGVYINGCVMRGSYVVRAEVVNPNLWLANYLGLINLPGIAWDLVPWSFVVNMFSNAASLVNSLTYDVGLSLTQQAVTIESMAQLRSISSDSWFDSTLSQVWTERNLQRTTGSPPPLSLVFRWPKGDFELGLIGGSLITQQVQRFFK